MSHLEKFKERLLCKDKFHSLLTGKKISDEDVNMFRKFGLNLE